MVAQTRAKSGGHAGRLVFLFWVLVACVYFYLSYDYIRVSMADDEFGEYIEYVVRLAGAEHRPAREIRTLLLIKAEELELPLRSNQITIAGGGSTLTVGVDYVVNIKIPIFQQGIYTKHFSHYARYKDPGAR